MSHRSKHLLMIQTPRGMAIAAAATARRRGQPNEHRFIIGGLRHVGPAIVLMAVYEGPAF